jgi:hypothetical protein
MDRGKRQGDRLGKVGAIWNCGTIDTTNESAITNYKHQYNTTIHQLAAANSTIHQYISYYQRTTTSITTRIPSNNESTAANNTQSIGKNANAGG